MRRSPAVRPIVALAFVAAAGLVACDGDDAETAATETTEPREEIVDETTAVDSTDGDDGNPLDMIFGTDEGDFRSSTEEFIDDDEGDVATQLGLTFEDAECEEPASTEAGTDYTCTATGSDGVEYTFSVVVSNDDEFEITGVDPQPDVADRPLDSTATTTAPTDEDDGGFFDPDEADFGDSAEEFIEDEDGDVAVQLGLTFTDVECTEPASTATGAAFTCTAIGSDGVEYTFSAEVRSDDEFEITGVDPQPG